MINLGRLDALNGRPKDYTSMDIRTPEYPQIFDFMTLGLFVVDRAGKKTEMGGFHPDLWGNHSTKIVPPNWIEVDFTPICGVITAFVSGLIVLMR